MPDPIEEFLSNYPEEIRRISAELRKITRNTMPKAHEFLYYDAINFSLDDSPLGRICYISPTEKYVTLGFLFGAQLDDPDHLLQGSGKRARHIKIRTLKETKNSALKELVKVAWSHGTGPVPMATRKPAPRSKR
ncbi:MAG TPA: DUF1801 domain-containing protein [Candidatus Bathyarchaeia archaeon]|nr:DUF1801 domain-containing protein [Candidatus Bathyarchaeia archaeon]